MVLWRWCWWKRCHYRQAKEESLCSGKTCAFLHFSSIRSFIEVCLSQPSYFCSLSLRFVYRCKTLMMFFFILVLLHARFPIIIVTWLGCSHCHHGDPLLQSHSHSHSKVSLSCDNFGYKTLALGLSCSRSHS